jgi:hypothetical protein
VVFTYEICVKLKYNRRGVPVDLTWAVLGREVTDIFLTLNLINQIWTTTSIGVVKEEGHAQ